MDSQRGSVLVLVALFSMVLMGFAALALDVGRQVVTRTRLQRVADAAALAGARDLPISPAAATAAAVDFAARNGLAISAGEVSFPTANRVEVSLDRPVSTTFARVFGIMSIPVPARSTAEVQGVSVVKRLRPWAIPEQDLENYQEGVTYTLKQGADLGHSSPGNFGALALDGNGANGYREMIIHGADDAYATGDTVTTEPGNMAGPTQEGVAHLMDGDPGHATYQDLLADGLTSSSRIVTVVVYAGSMGNGRSSVSIAKFASFFITGYQHPGQVTGQFIRYVDLSASASGAVAGSGTQTIALVD